MSRRDRIAFLSVLGIFVVLQLMGLLGFFFGTGRITSVNYTQWAGYFVVIGTVANMFLVAVLVIFLAPPIFKALRNWIDRGKDETDPENDSAGTSLRHHYAAPITSIPTTVRERPTNVVQSYVSGSESPVERTRKARREQAKLRASG